MYQSKNPDVYYGVATVKANGKELKLTEVVFRPSGIKYEDVNNGKGFVPVEVGAMLKGKKYLAKGDDIDKLLSEDGVTIVFKSNTGHAWTMDNACRMEMPEISKDGYDLEYHSAESQEITNG